MHVRAGRSGHVGGGDRLNAADVAIEVVVQQIVDDELLDVGREIAERLEFGGQAERDVVRRLAQLLLDGCGDGLQLVEELAQRLGRLVGLHASAGDEGAW
jgi:hypothetical protein